MIKKIQYNSLGERNDILADNLNLILIEEDNIKEGNFLVFSDVAVIPQPIYINVPQEDFIELQDRLISAEEKNAQILLAMVAGGLM